MKAALLCFWSWCLMAGGVAASMRVPGGDETKPAPHAIHGLAGLTWTSTEPLIVPLPDAPRPLVAVKDPTVVRHDGHWHIFATTSDLNGTWGMAYFRFANWSEAGSVQPFHLDQTPTFAGYNCAPQVFYFRPHRKWYLIYQSPQPRFSVTDDLSQPESWTAPEDFFEDTPASVVEGWLDYWIICDATHAYLFFADDHGRFYRSRTRLADFPRGFDEPVVVLHENVRDFYEGLCVYKVKGADQYLCLVECIAAQGARYYRALTADRLDGEWRWLPGADSEAEPFAGPGNVTASHGGPLWTIDISHGELLRDGSDETMTIDPQNLRFLYQGRRASSETQYALLPYRLALLSPLGATSLP